MAGQVAHADWNDAGAVVQHLHTLVTNGPRDLDIALRMSRYGFDEVKWAEGQGILAELIHCDSCAEASLAMVVEWYNEAADVAQSALASHPQLLAKLGMA